jgi:hypothetical protein
MAITVTSINLYKMDGTVITSEEFEETHMLRGKVAFCITEGFLPSLVNTLREQSDLFLLTKQKEATSQHSLVLQYINMEGSLREDSPVRLQVCLQDRRPLQERRVVKFQSNHIFPVELTVQGDAAEVFVLGSMNKWKDPLPLSRCEDSTGVFFHTTLYLPPGDYEYRYIVDGEEKVSESNKAMSKYNQGVCNIYKVTEYIQEMDAETTTTLLHIRWLRSNIHSGFDLIEGANSLTYTPSPADVGCCLRAEVLSYIGGQFEALVFDITPPITSGLPSCGHLELKGMPIEGSELEAVTHYSGGVEGWSTYQWLRCIDGVETPVVSSNDVDREMTGESTSLTRGNKRRAPTASQQRQSNIYHCKAEDVGCKLKVVYIPSREDGIQGPPVVAVSEIIRAVPAEFKQNLSLSGTNVEGEPLTLTAFSQDSFPVLSESTCRFRWYRKNPLTQTLTPIATGTKTYTPIAEDIGSIIVVEFTPSVVSTSSPNSSSLTTTYSTTSTIQQASPAIKSLQLEGAPEEHKPLTAQFRYIGGIPSSHHKIQWWKIKDNFPDKFNLPTSTSCTYTCQTEDIGYYVGVTIIPVREDGLQGSPCSAQTTSPVTGELPKLTTLAMINSEKLVEGQEIQLQAVYQGGVEGHSIIQWYRSSNIGAQALSQDEDNYVHIEEAINQRRYVPTSADVGHKMKCKYTPVREDGTQGMPSSSVSIEIVEPAPPRIIGIVELISAGIVYKGKFHYSGGKSSDAHTHQWIRINPANSSESIICTTVGKESEYKPTAPDRGCRLKYGIRPKREDGVEGEWCYSQPSAVIRLVSEPSPVASASSTR